MNDNNKKVVWSTRITAAFKNFFTKNLALKIISLIFAMLLWGYVMMETDPSRIKVVSNVSVSFEGEDELLSKNLTVRGDRGELLPKVTVQVSTKLTKYSSLDAASITASVNLRSISKPDTYKLRINATALDGSVVDISPSEILLEVDDLAARTVPIEVDYVGALSDDYWRGEPTLSTQSLIVRGAAEDVSRVVKAICPITLTDRTTSYNESVGITLVDGTGEEVSSSLFIDTLPSVVVKMDVLKTVVLTVDAASAVLGADSLPANYEVVDIVPTPAQVRVAGSEENLANLSSIIPAQIDVSGSNTSILQTLALHVPENVLLLDDPDVNVFVDIREKNETRFFSGIDIEVRNLGRKMDAILAESLCDVTITGRVSLIRKLDRGDITLYVDAEGLAAGQHVAPILVELPGGEMTSELSYGLSAQTVTLTIRD
ncbi:MAG: CdaR family protein [Candidatus Pelethousia sp.]|nr:CdaR family protein [Candidatus Pelethousia sp.]